jgi:hypothetical protein
MLSLLKRAKEYYKCVLVIDEKAELYGQTETNANLFLDVS